MISLNTSRNLTAFKNIVVEYYFGFQHIKGRHDFKPFHYKNA